MIKPFLLELAEKIYADHKRSLERVTLIFPNRRASLYFRKHLSNLLERPAFSPVLLTIEDFISGFSPLKVPDKIQLIHQLYHVYHNVTKSENASIQESFDQFYFWGEMLLRDFDEADKYLVKTDHLFKDLSNQKELDAGFDFLTDEQREFLKSFWINFDEKDSVNKRRFLEIWRKLPEVYAAFKHTLLNQNLAYDGMLHRQVAENIHLTSQTLHLSQSIVFAGFNALTKAEEVIINYFVENRNAAVSWDTDAYYVNNQTQEAGQFFREYKQHPVLGNTFSSDIPSNLKKEKRFNLYAASQPIGQAKILGQTLREKLKGGFIPEETIVVLPDERLLTPVLHGLPSDLDKLNVTMGFPLASTPLYNLIELLVELQLSGKLGHFNHRPVVALLGHPYVVSADAASAQAKRKEILLQNWVHVSENFLNSHTELHRRIFSILDHPRMASYLIGLIEYLKTIITEIGGLQSISEFDKEYCFHFIRMLNKMEDVFQEDQTGDQESSSESMATNKEALKSFMRLFRQVTRAEKIPFSGEPLRGLQIMGVLETRNLDFKNVFIASLNEGTFPAFASKNSYIPYNIRKAYGLPTVEKQDAMYAYLFYRMLQRAENVFLFYNSETDELGQGEMSRYLQQLLYESGFKFERHLLHNELRPSSVSPLVIKKDERVFEALANYLIGSNQKKSLSPSALNDYLECRLKFYFRYVAKVREPNEVEEELDARVLGNFLHEVMEFFYRDIIEGKGNFVIEESDFENTEDRVRSLIDKAFISNYGLNPEKRVVYEGQRLVVREIVKRFVDRIIQIDKAYAPFTIEALERRDLSYQVEVSGGTVLLGGSIDRADRKENVVRVIDYKTGKDALLFHGVPSLFSRDGKRNKAAFQTFVYTLLYRHNLRDADSLRFVPGLMNRINLFNEDFSFGLMVNSKDYLTDASPMMEEFETQVRELVKEIYDPEVPFDQTSETEPCKYCSYSKICYR